MWRSYETPFSESISNIFMTAATPIYLHTVRDRFCPANGELNNCSVDHAACEACCLPVGLYRARLPASHSADRGHDFKDVQRWAKGRGRPARHARAHGWPADQRPSSVSSSWRSPPRKGSLARLDLPWIPDRVENLFCEVFFFFFFFLWHLGSLFCRCLVWREPRENRAALPQGKTVINHSSCPLYSLS